MTMTPSNLPHGQWSKKLTMTMTPSILLMVSMVKLTNFDHLTTVILEFWLWSWSKMAIFDHLTTATLKFWPWSWSKIFDHLTMTPGRRPNGQKIVVILPPPPKFPRTSEQSFCDTLDFFAWKLQVLSEHPGLLA